MKRKTILTYGTLVLGLGLAGYLLGNIFSEYTWADIVQSVSDIPAGNLAAAGGFCAASYLCLTGFDWAGVRYVKNDLAYPKIALASFVSLSIGQSVGLAGLSSGGLRYRYYAHWGMNAEDVAKIVLLSGVTVGIGLAMLTGIVMPIVGLRSADPLMFAVISTLIVSGLVGLFVTPFYVALLLSLYWDLKLRKEGGDLAARIGALSTT